MTKRSAAVGTDIVDVARIRRLTRSQRFLKRVFTPEEIRYCAGMKNAAQHFAVRFAAKEAVWKALSSVCHSKGISHKEIGVQRSSGGQPFITLSGRLKKFEKKISISLSHTQEYAVAIALYVR